MKIAFVINQTHKELESFTTTLLAWKALKAGHEVAYIGLADFYYENNQAAAHVRYVRTSEQVGSTRDLIDILRKKVKENMLLREFDVLWLRFDPVLDMISRPWAAASGLQFAELAKRAGVFVLNNPDTLSLAQNKLYLENFDATVRPKTMVTRSYDDVLAFFEDNGKRIILKPLKGSGGKNVFLIDTANQQNLKQVVEAIARDGYVIAQEYLADAVNGDIRFFVLNGKPLVINGKHAAVRRVQQENEIRSNVHQGASVQPAEIDERILNVVDKVAAQLLKDGMFFVGLDIVGDKIMEINVFSPGALPQAEKMCGEDFSSEIIRYLEQQITDRKGKL